MVAPGFQFTYVPRVKRWCCPLAVAESAHSEVAPPALLQQLGIAAAQERVGPPRGETAAWVRRSRHPRSTAAEGSAPPVKVAAAGHISPGRHQLSEVGVNPALSRNCDAPSRGMSQVA